MTGVDALSSPILMDIMLSDGSGCPDFHHPSWISCRVSGVGALNSPILMAIMSSDGSGCFEFPNPHGYHVE